MSDLFNTDNGGFVLGVIGKRGSGKSYLAIQLLISKTGLKDKFDDIILISPTMDYDRKWEFLDISEKKKFREFSQELVDVLFTMFEQKSNKNPDERYLIVFDDCVSSHQFNKRTNYSALNKLAFLGRHINVSMVIISQKYKAIPFQVRSQFDYLVLFNTSNHSEYRAIEEEIGIGDRTKWKDIWKECFNEKYDYMLIDVSNSNVYASGVKLNLNCPRGNSICHCKKNKQVII